MKTDNEYFRDWESHVFGCGYGDGERVILPALKTFLELCKKGSNGNSYEFADLQELLTPTVAWLLINVLCKAGIIEYGTSSRYGWLTSSGVKLKEFVSKHTVHELITMVTDYPEDYTHCYPNYCNCGPQRSSYFPAEQRCQNPFWEGE